MHAFESVTTDPANPDNQVSLERRAADSEHAAKIAGVGKAERRRRGMEVLGQLDLRLSGGLGVRIDNRGDTSVRSRNAFNRMKPAASRWS